MGTALSIAVYFIVWWLTLFVVMPFGVRTQGEDGEVVPGTPRSAPAAIRIWRLLAINTVIATIVFAVLYFGIRTGWISAEYLDFSGLPAPPEQ